MEGRAVSDQLVLGYFAVAVLYAVALCPTAAEEANLGAMSDQARAVAGVCLIVFALAWVAVIPISVAAHFLGGGARG